MGYNVEIEKIDNSAHKKAIHILWSDEPLRRALRAEVDLVLLPAQSVLEGSEDMNAIIKARGQIQALKGLMLNLEKLFDDEEKKRETNEEVVKDGKTKRS